MTETHSKINEKNINVKEYSVNQLNGNFEDINFIEIENESDVNDLVLNQPEKSGKMSSDFFKIFI